MEILNLPYIFPMFLGMTFDARSFRPGVDIFDAKYVDEPKVQDFGRSKSTYVVASSLSDVKRALDVSGELSLKIKTGLINIKGKGSYIKNEKEFDNRVEILSTSEYISRVESFKQGAKPRNGWHELYKEEVLGTHYVQTIVYGAELIASAKFIALDSNDFEDIKATIQGELNTAGDSLNLFVNGTVDKLSQKLSGKANLDISYYATVPLKSVPTTLQGLKSLIRSFGDQVENLGGGIPLMVKLQPLTLLAPPDEVSKFEYEKNKALEDVFGDLEEKFDELRQARLDLITWTNGLPDILPMDIRSKIGKLYTEITRVTDVFYKTVVNMDLTKGPEQLLTALNAYYEKDETRGYRLYAQEVQRLKYDLGPKIPVGDVSSYSYIHWGNSNCTAPGTTVLYQGFAFSSTEDHLGGTSKYDCAPSSLKGGDELVAIANFGDKSTLAGIRYPDLNKKSKLLKGSHAKKVLGQGVPCAKCYSPDSHHIVMIPASNKCPLMRELIYSGYLASSRSHEGHTTEYICLDDEPSAPYDFASLDISGKNSLAFTVVKSQGHLPSSVFEEGDLVRCVVCSTE